jgi:hypothetical protein
MENRSRYQHIETIIHVKLVSEDNHSITHVCRWNKVDSWVMWDG